MDGRSNFLLLRIENRPTPPDQSFENRVKTATGASETAHSLDRVERDTQQVKLGGRWSYGTADLLHLLSIQLAMLRWNMTTGYEDVGRV
jgi:hypothetical protein